MAYNFNSLIDNFFNKSKDIGNVFLLQTSLTTIEQSHEDKCPVCSQAIDRETLLNDLKERVRVLEEYDRDVKDIRQSGGLIRGKLDEVHNTLVDIGKKEYLDATNLKI